MVVAARKLDALTNLELMIKKVIVMMATMMVLGICKLYMLHAKCHGYAAQKPDLTKNFLDLIFFRFDAFYKKL